MVLSNHEYFEQTNMRKRRQGFHSTAMADDASHGTCEKDLAKLTARSRGMQVRIVSRRIKPRGVVTLFSHVLQSSKC